MTMTYLAMYPSHNTVLITWPNHSYFLKCQLEISHSYFWTQVNSSSDIITVLLRVTLAPPRSGCLVCAPTSPTHRAVPSSIWSPAEESPVRLWPTCRRRSSPRAALMSATILCAAKEGQLLFFCLLNESLLNFCHYEHMHPKIFGGDVLYSNRVFLLLEANASILCHISCLLGMF